MRRRSRECALQILYQLDANDGLEGGGADEEELLAQSLEAYWKSFEDDAPVDRDFTERLVRGVAAGLEDVDSSLQDASANWRLERMSKVDRGLLRLAAYELLYCPDIPAKVSINEALEIAKRFSGADSAAFINGILDSVAKNAEGRG